VVAGLRHNGAEKLPCLSSLACGRLLRAKLTPPLRAPQEECVKWKSASPPSSWCFRDFHSESTLLAPPSGL